MRFRPATSVTEYIIAMSAGADVRRDVARCDRRHHHLRAPDRQGAHRRRDDRRAARSADADDAADRCLVGADVRLERHRHRADGLAAIRRDDGRGAVRVVAATSPAFTSATRLVVSVVPTSTSDRDHARRLDDVARRSQLVTLGVERADDVARALIGTSDRQLRYAWRPTPCTGMPCAASTSCLQRVHRRRRLGRCAG